MIKIKSHLATEYICKNKAALVVIVVVGVLQSCITFLLPVSIGEFFSIQFHAGSSKGRLLELLGIHFTSLAAFFVFFFGVLVLKAVVFQAEQWLSLKEGEKFVKMTRERLFAEQLRQEAIIFKRKGYGNYLLRYSNDLKAVKNYLLTGVLSLFKNSIFLLIGFVLLGLIHFQLAAYLVILFLLLLTGIFFLANYQKKFIQKSRDKRSNLLTFVTKSFGRYARIKANSNEQDTISRFNEKSDQLYEANLKNNQLESIQQSLIPFLQYAMLGALLFLSTIVSQRLTHENALVFVLVTLMLFSSMRKILKVPGTLNKGNISLVKIEELIQ
ncbi:MAG: ABC transporter transmembrane domain-containing protein [Chitinophagaceae bacterium]